MGEGILDNEGLKKNGQDNIPDEQHKVPQTGLSAVDEGNLSRTPLKDIAESSQSKKIPGSMVSQGKRLLQASHGLCLNFWCICAH